MKAKLQVLFLSCVLILITNSCSSDSTTEPPPELTLAQKFQNALDEGVVNYGGKGVAVAIIIPGENPWFGMAGVSHGTTPVTNDMLFATGSTTKNFAATLTLQLAEEGKLSLDDSLHNWIQSFPQIDSTITIRQLLNHTNGIFNFSDHPTVWNNIFSNPTRHWTHEEVITNFVLSPYFQPGQGWHYSNSGYVLLAMILENVTGTSLSSELRNRFWIPLGMNSTYLPIEETLPGPVAHGWFDLNGNGNYEDISSYSIAAFTSAASLAGAVYSTSEDLAKWAKALFHDKTVLSQNSLDQMLTFYSPIPDQPLLDGYGLGVINFSRDLFNNLEIIGHSGDAPGYAAASLYLPAYGVCIGGSDNTGDGNSMGVLNDLLDIIIDHLNE